MGRVYRCVVAGDYIGHRGLCNTEVCVCVCVCVFVVACIGVCVLCKCVCVFVGQYVTEVVSHDMSFVNILF